MPSSASLTTVVSSAFVTAVFAALIASATFATVVSLSPSPAFACALPALFSIAPVTAATLPASSSLIVVPSAFTDTPFASTLTPPLSFALTETLLSAETEIPYPAVTGVLPPAAPPPCGCSALIVTMCLPVSSVVLVTVTPSPLNSTSSPLFTVEAAPPFAETFQPNSFNALDKSPALTSFFLFPSSGAVTLPLVTLRSMVSGTSLLSFPIVNPSPCFTLNLAERPSWSIVIPPSSRR